ncbi:MAG: NAD/NADP octopine/nopaline dehydrogenase family protein [Armatimonadota bacterium]|nr:NAD/NADP octopine/nopaline dehydrogenase family protein [Armatimonadota bacterium]
MGRSAIAILGAGNTGQGLAGILASQGEEVRLYDRSERSLEPIREAGGIHLRHAVEGFGRPQVLTTEMEVAVAGADLVMITVPAYGHRVISQILARHIRPGQIVVFQPGSLGSALEFDNMVAERGSDGIVVAETETCLYTSRIAGPARVDIRAKKKSVALAALPATRTSHVVAVLGEPSGGGYVPAESLLQIGLGNMNPVYHCAPFLCNIGSVERGEDRPFFQFVTESIARLVDLVDRERLALAGALGVRATSFWTFLETAYGASGGTFSQRIHAAYGRGQPTAAPKTLGARYLTEDVPFGLVPWSSLARHLSVPTPTIDALIQMASALCGRDFRQEGRTVETLGLSGLDAGQIRARFIDGVRSEGGRG